MLSLVSILAAGSLASADIRSILLQQGFPGPLNGRETIEYVGRIQENPNIYQIYLYRGSSKAAAVNHGINWLIVVKNGRAYSGGYRIPMPSRCKVERLKVICNAGIFKFTRNGPPKQIVFDGEELNFSAGRHSFTSRSISSACPRLGASG